MVPPGYVQKMFLITNNANGDDDAGICIQLPTAGNMPPYSSRSTPLPLTCTGMELYRSVSGLITAYCSLKGGMLHLCIYKHGLSADGSTSHKTVASFGCTGESGIVIIVGVTADNSTATYVTQTDQEFAAM